MPLVCDPLWMLKFDRLSHILLTPFDLWLDGFGFIRLSLRPRCALAAENLFLRKQLALYLERKVKPRRAKTATKLTLVWLSNLFVGREALAVVKPDTLIRWHRQGLRLFWKWKSKPRGRVVSEKCVEAHEKPLASPTSKPYPENMKAESNHASIEALENILSEIDLILCTTTPLPENRTPRCRELINAALAITSDLLKQGAESPAVALGHKGGSTTAERHGKEHDRMMAAARKTHAGGRPRKKAQ
jgi:hypothetical protein